MALIAIMTAAIASGEPTVIWLNAYEISSDGIDVPTAGAYRVWVWTREDESAAITIGGPLYSAGRRVSG